LINAFCITAKTSCSMFQKDGFFMEKRAFSNYKFSLCITNSRKTFNVKIFFEK
jgi:hypothetical protein